MTQQQSSYPPSSPLIPKVECPRCRDFMRLTLMEPAALSPGKRDSLVFQCTCGFSFKQPMQYGGVNKQGSSEM